MCNTFDEYWNRGLEQGIERGLEQNRINLLNRILLEADRIEDLKRSISDGEFQRKLLQELLPAES